MDSIVCGNAGRTKSQMDACLSLIHIFLEMMARTLGLSLEEMSTMGLEWKENIVISRPLKSRSKLKVYVSSAGSSMA